MDRRKDTAVEAILEQLIEHGPSDLAGISSRAIELAMQIERERFLGAGLYERSPVPQLDLFDFDSGTKGQMDFLSHAFICTEGAILTISSPESDEDPAKMAPDTLFVHQASTISQKRHQSR
jgi:hypothetical protein